MKFVGRIMDATTGGEGRYEFEGPDKLLKKTPVRVVKTFMEEVAMTKSQHEIEDFEINAAFKNAEHNVVTCMGSLMLENGGRLPFLLMVSPALEKGA